MILRNLLSDKQKKRFENPTFIGLPRVSRMNMVWENHLHISNGGLLLVNISHICTGAVCATLHHFWLCFCIQINGKSFAVWDFSVWTVNCLWVIFLVAANNQLLYHFMTWSDMTENAIMTWHGMQPYILVIFQQPVVILCQDVTLQRMVWYGMT